MVPPSERDHPGLPAPGAPPVAADEQLDDILSIVEDLRRQLKNCKEMNAKLADELSSTQKRAIEAEGKVGKLTDEVDRSKRLLAVCQTENETLISEAVAGQEDQHETAREIQRLRLELSSAVDKTKSLETEIERLRRISVDLADQASANEEPLRKRVQDLEQELEERSSTRGEQSRELHRLEVALSDLSREKEELQVQVEALERYRKAMSRIHGALRGGPER
jgi:chromosome segregation ATPase